jgi:DNA polymerase-3 subunit beta
MKFTVRRNDLLRELLLIKGVVDQATAIPILSHTLVTARLDSLRLFSTTLNISLFTDRCPVTVLEPGETTLHAKTFLDLVTAMPEAEITVESTGPSTSLKVERFASKLQSLSVETFPAIPYPSGDRAILTRSVLLEATAKVFALKDDPHRHYLGGALLELRGGVMCIMSTDSHRMSIIKAPYHGADSLALIPQFTIDELRALLKEGTDDIQYQFSENQIFFTVDGRVLYSTIIDGVFPDLSRITNQVKDITIVFEREKLLNAVTRVALVADPTNRAIQFTLRPGAVTIHAATSSGEAEEILPVNYDGGEITIAFHVGYVLDFLTSVSAEAVSMSLSDARQPIFWRELGVSAYDYVYIVSPMQA